MKKLLSLGLLLFLFQSAFAAPWDFLRIPVEIAGPVNPLVMWLFFFVSLILLVIALLAFKKRNSQKLMFVSGAFALFFIKALFSLIDLYFSPGIFMNFAVQGVFDLLILVCLFIALFRK